MKLFFSFYASRKERERKEKGQWNILSSWKVIFVNFKWEELFSNDVKICLGKKLEVSTKSLSFNEPRRFAQKRFKLLILSKPLPAEKGFYPSFLLQNNCRGMMEKQKVILARRGSEISFGKTKAEKHNLHETFQSQRKKNEFRFLISRRAQTPKKEFSFSLP